MIDNITANLNSKIIISLHYSMDERLGLHTAEFAVGPSGTIRLDNIARIPLAVF